MHRTVIRAAATMALTLILATVLSTATSLAETAPNVGTAQEAWFHASLTGGEEDDPTCTLPTGCAPAAAPAPAAEDTLQVGAAVGRDRARTFLSLDLDAIPEGAFLTGGTLTLPVLEDEESGSVRPETADLLACAVGTPFKSVQGGAPDKQPDYDCDTFSRLKFDASAKPPAFTVDLRTLASTLSFGGIAIVPSPAARAEGGTFQVAFPAEGHASKDKITAALTYDPPFDFEPPAPPEPFEPPPPPPPDTDFSAPPPSSSSGSAFSPGVADPGVSGVPGVAQVDQAAPPPANAGVQRPVAAGSAPLAVSPMPGMVGTTSFYAYPGVWLAPLALLGVAGLLARSLAGEIILPESVSAGGSTPADGPNLFQRLAAAVRPPAQV